ncbi:MAG TPA: cupin domain-containing protein [Baekduia sp.]|uniref:cupin domain-containing protein n=1 Tax=Baekduia sp. TaxID=2600305 RepID=UPI002D77CAB3|nr:cupin domain-containing protein [Baekduia sp.]HET6510539.1 cupin domain-containing protein [Baekduia sp.]
MAQTGDRFAMPDGSVYVVRRPAAESDGAFVEMEFVLPSGCVPPPPHVHRHGVEEYEVLEGSFEVVIDGVWRTMGVGDFASVPVGALHTFRNRSGAVVRVRNRHRPAMGFEDFIAATCAALREAGIARPRDPRIPFVLSRVMLRYDDTLAPGRRRERVPMRALAAIARVLPGVR